MEERDTCQLPNVSVTLCHWNVFMICLRKSHLDTVREGYGQDRPVASISSPVSGGNPFPQIQLRFVTRQNFAHSYLLTLMRYPTVVTVLLQSVIQHDGSSKFVLNFIFDKGKGNVVPVLN
jgi:hypothetical protein